MSYSAFLHLSLFIARSLRRLGRVYYALYSFNITYSGTDPLVKLWMPETFTCLYYGNIFDLTEELLKIILHLKWRSHPKQLWMNLEYSDLSNTLLWPAFTPY